MLMVYSRGLAHDGADFLCFVVRNGNTKFLLKFHDQFHGVEGVSTKVVGKACFGLYFICINTQFINDDVRYFCYDF